MASLNWTILFLLGITAAISGSTGGELNDKENTDDSCVALCGTNSGVKCYYDITKKHTMTCICEDSNKIFDHIRKECKDDKCVEKCGLPYNKENDKLRCYVSTYGEVECLCKYWKEEFDSKDKTCKVPCKNNYDCKSNTTCNADKFCVCKDGYVGEYCNVTNGCRYMKEYCDAIGMKCVFDKESPKNATCECKDGYVYDPKLNICKNSYCYPNNPCKDGLCTYDKTIEAGYCLCSRDQYYNYKTQKCEVLPDEVCINGTCKCKHIKEPGEECKPRFCSQNPCFGRSICSERNTSCYCGEGMYYLKGMCKYTHCNLQDFKKTCDCPLGTKRNENRECEPVRNEVCFKDCGYGVCIDQGHKETCKCFRNIAVDSRGKCILNKNLCAGGRLQENLMKCECRGQYTQADDGITCKLRTCEDIDVKNECARTRSECRMDWKRNGYYCKCPKGYEIGDNGVCTDLCSIEKNFRACAVRDQICYNSFSPINNNTIACRCPPTVKMADGKCYGKAEDVYIIKNIPVLKEKYKMMFGINKVLLNEDLMTSVEQIFSVDLFDYGSLIDFREEGDIIKCSVWINFKKAPSSTELRKIYLVPHIFSHNWHLSKTAIIWPPRLLLSKKDFEKVKIEPLTFCSAEVRDLLCGKGATCMYNECSCGKGFKTVEYSFRDLGDYKIQKCEDIDECATGISTCSRNTTCVNTFGDYKCICKDGFKKRERVYYPETDKSNCYDMCTPSPCLAGNCSLIGKTFKCKCPSGYSGLRCESFYWEYKNDGMPSSIIIGLLVGVPLIIVVACVGFCTASRRRRTRQKPVSGTLPSAPQVNHTEMMETAHMQEEVNKTKE